MTEKEKLEIELSVLKSMQKKEIDLSTFSTGALMALYEYKMGRISYDEFLKIYKNDPCYSGPE
jgi:hypothetical protein